MSKQRRIKVKVTIPKTSNFFIRGDSEMGVLELPNQRNGNDSLKIEIIDYRGQPVNIEFILNEPPF